MPARSTATSLVAGVALTLAVAPGLQGQDLVESEIREWGEEHLEEAIALLERVVNINSGSANPDGVREVGAIFEQELDALGFRTWWTDAPADGARAGHLFAERAGGDLHVLLIGHLDTVFEPDHPFQRFARDGMRATGPGVDDMKGGDVALLYALKALAAVGALDDLTVTVALIGDEESPGEPLDFVRAPLIEAGKTADLALGFEGGIRDASGEFATIARRSASGWRLEVHGRQGHSSQVFSEALGAGAINEAARILTAFYDEVRGEEYLTFNAGNILGGTDVEYDVESRSGTASGKTNVVPQYVTVHGGIRTISDEQLERARSRMREIVAQSLPGTRAEITFEDGYPAMAPTEGNRALMEVYDQVSRDLGYGSLQVLDPGRRGAADISFVAPYTTALAGMGPIGEGAHSPDEAVDLASLVPSMVRAAVLLRRLARGDLVMDR